MSAFGHLDIPAQPVEGVHRRQYSCRRRPCDSPSPGCPDTPHCATPAPCWPPVPRSAGCSIAWECPIRPRAQRTARGLTPPSCSSFSSAPLCFPRSGWPPPAIAPEEVTSMEPTRGL